MKITCMHELVGLVVVDVSEGPVTLFTRVPITISILLVWHLQQNTSLLISFLRDTCNKTHDY